MYRNAEVERPDLREACRTLNAEIGAIRDLLSIADVADMVPVRPKAGVSAYSLVAGDKAVIVVLVQYTRPQKTATDSAGKEAALQAAGGSMVAVKLPPWAAAVSLAQGVGGKTETVTFDQGGDGEARFHARSEDGARAYVLSVKRTNR